MTRRFNLSLLVYILIIIYSFAVSLDAVGIVALIYLMWKKNYSDFTSRVRGLTPLIYLIPLLILIGQFFRHLSFHTHAYDLTFVNQALFHPWGLGAWLKSDLSINGSYFGEHLSFSFFLVSWITKYLQSDYLVFLIQNLILTFSILWIIKRGPAKDLKHLHVLIFLMIFSSRSFRGAYFFDFREDAIAFAGIIFLLWSLSQRKLLFYLLSLTITLLSKENYSFICLFIPFGILLDQDLGLTKRDKWIYSILTWALALIWLIISFKILIPYFTSGVESGHPIVTRFKEFGSTPGMILVNILTTPRYWAVLLNDYLLGWDRLKYLVYLLAPFIVIGRNAWVWLLPAIPGIAFNLLAPNHAHRSMSFHYDLMVLPFLLMMLVLGARKINKEKTWALAFCIALSFSSKWPTYKLRIFFPTISDIKNSFYLSNLDENEITAASKRTLAHLNYINDLRPFNKTTYAGLEAFKREISAQDGRSKKITKEATRWVINNLDDNEKKIKEFLLQDGAKLVSDSFDGRFSYLSYHLVSQ